MTVISSLFFSIFQDWQLVPVRFHYSVVYGAVVYIVQLCWRGSFHKHIYDAFWFLQCGYLLSILFVTALPEKNRSTLFLCLFHVDMPHNVVISNCTAEKSLTITWSIRNFPRNVIHNYTYIEIDQSKEFSIPLVKFFTN